MAPLPRKSSSWGNDGQQKAKKSLEISLNIWNISKPEMAAVYSYKVDKHFEELYKKSMEDLNGSNWKKFKQLLVEYQDRSLLSRKR